jgi:hypothetical protein
MKKERNPMCLSLSNSYLTLVHQIKEQQALTRRFFIIFTYDDINGPRTKEPTEIAGALMQAAYQARRMFEQCGNEVVTFKNVHEENDFLLDTLYTFYNRKTSIHESYKQRVGKIRNDYEKVNANKHRNRESQIPIVDFVAPRGIDFTHRDYVLMDGMYYSVLFITSDGYPNLVPAGWISAILGSGDGVDVDIHLHKTDRSKTIDDVNRKLRLNKIKIKNTYDTANGFEQLAGSIDSAYFIKEQLASGDDLLQMAVFVTVSARTLGELAHKKKSIIDMMKTRDIELRNSLWQQEQALMSVAPLMRCDKNLFNKSKRNIMSTSAAALYPFTAFEMCDDNGILLGVNKYNSSMTILDLFNTKLHSNANLTVLGSSGKGKTFLMLLMAARMRMRGIQVFLIAPIKGDEFRRVCSALGGTYVKIAPSSTDCINVMEIRNIDRTKEMLISGEDIAKEPMLMKKIDQLNVFFSLLIPDMSLEEQQIMDEALMNTFEEKGITADNDTLYLDKDKKHYRPMPTLGDLHKVLKEKPRAERLTTIVSRFVTGSAQVFNGQTNVNLNNKLVVLDMSDLSKSMKSIGMFIGLDFVWDRAKSDRTERKAIMIDEVWQLIGAQSSPLAAGFVQDIYKLIRGYGGAAISATQDLGDFFALEDGKFGRAIINNSATKIVLGLGEEESDRIATSMKLSPKEQKSILAAQTGEALISSGGGKVTVNIIASPKEREMITTDRKDLEAIAQRASVKNK